MTTRKNFARSLKREAVLRLLTHTEAETGAGAEDGRSDIRGELCYTRLVRPVDSNVTPSALTHATLRVCNS